MCVCVCVCVCVYFKLTYCDHPNKNKEYLDLKITRI